MLIKKLFEYSRSVYTRLSERRDSERLDSGGTVIVSRSHRHASTYVCSCVNLSDSGIGLQAFEPLPVNCDVYLHSDRHGLNRFGRVRWCVLRGDRYYIGCNFRPAPKGRIVHSTAA